MILKKRSKSVSRSNLLPKTTSLDVPISTPKVNKRLNLSLSLLKQKKEQHKKPEITKEGDLKTAKKSEKYLLKSRGHIPKEYLELIGEAQYPKENSFTSYNKAPFTQQTILKRVNHNLYLDKSIDFSLKEKEVFRKEKFFGKFLKSRKLKLDLNQLRDTNVKK